METLDTIFLNAREISDLAERAAYLTTACGTDADLRGRVEAMLQDAEGAEVFFGPKDGMAHAAADAPLTEGPGTVIGRYKLLQKIGEGGMGVVYMAEQREPVVRKVALKIIKLGMDTRQVVARFEAERQALAMMDHPNIAKILDAGVTGSAESQISNLKSEIHGGRPYFVLDLVQGLPITQFCDEANLSTRERLDLFLDVCSAIQHAHQKGIIHRDIKPSNILVTLHGDKPVPKVIDFGIAKATQGRLTEKTLFTQFQQFIGTPAYMSPEQASLSGLDIDTRSDIYGLGVLLYELLTGKTPFDGKELMKAGLDEMRRTIREKEPPRPSTRLTHELARQRVTAVATPAATTRRLDQLKQLITLLRGDLDWVVMKCLEKDRNRRYETANGLAADIKRFLGSEPVVARPPTAVYRMQKAIRRNKLAFTAGVAVVLVLLAGIAVSSWQAVRATRARAEAEKAREQANQRLRDALVFVDEVFKKVAPEIAQLTGAANARETLGQAGLRFLESLRAGARDDPGLRVALARLLLHVSGAQNPGIANTVGDYEGGLTRAEEAIELLNTEALTLTLAERLYLLFWAKNDMVYCLAGLGRWDEVVTRSKELEPLIDQLERFPERTQWARTQRMITRADAGAAMVTAGRPREAIERYIQPFLNSDYARGITNTSSEDELKCLICAYDSLTSAFGSLKQFEVILPAANEAIRIAEVLVQRFPRNARYAVGRAFSWSQQGYAMMLTGHTNEGLAALRKARAEVESLVSKDAANDLFREFRAVIAAIQAMAFAGWSGETSAPLAERRQRLAQADKYLAEAEQFCRASKAKEPEGWREAARAEVATAKAKLEADGSAQPKP